MRSSPHPVPRSESSVDLLDPVLALRDDTGPQDVREEPIDSVSVVIPFHNEEAAVEEMIVRVRATLISTARRFEIIAVDDGSTDRTPHLLRSLAERIPELKVVRLRSNYGQTAGLAAGFDHASGEVVIAMDGDLQHVPEEIPRFLARIDEGFDVVSGWRVHRRDHALLRRLPSRVANWLMAKVSGVPLHDFGTTFKAYRAEVIRDLRLYGDFHRFIPALTSPHRPRIAEIPIENPPRSGGVSKYGLGRTVTVAFDIVRIKLITHYFSRPLQVFGTIGILLVTISGLVIAYLVWMKIAHGMHIMVERGPLLLLSMLTMIVGSQFFAIGLIGEYIYKVFAELSGKPCYAVRERIGFDRAPAPPPLR